MNFWIAYPIVFIGWWVLYSFVSDRMTDLGVGWINAMYPHTDAQHALASKLTFAKHILFAGDAERLKRFQQEGHVITLAPGNYTAILSGVNGTAGVGLVEVYAQQPQAGTTPLAIP